MSIILVRKSNCSFYYRTIIGNILNYRHNYTPFAFTDLVKDKISKNKNISRYLLDTLYWNCNTNEDHNGNCNLIQKEYLENREFWIKSVFEKIEQNDLKKVVILDYTNENLNLFPMKTFFFPKIFTYNVYEMTFIIDQLLKKIESNESPVEFKKPQESFNKFRINSPKRWNV